MTVIWTEKRSTVVVFEFILSISYSWTPFTSPYAHVACVDAVTYLNAIPLVVLTVGTARLNDYR